MKTAAILVVVVCAVASGRLIKRDYENSDYVNGGSGHGRDSDEQDASVSRENIGECGGVVGKGYDVSPEVAYNRDGRAPVEEHHGAGGGQAFSKASATASASSSSYNMNHKTNLIPV
ncbi:uncharacterized protein LOC119190635 [Manduca sexta]|uniref:uncharacterized protein LOC119190635 n=1 Tax=Manduca sexta TaxID=7130 RepID=UPI00188E5C34|nr:uncharacterized protein LOC119190635 [Manduca sexta]